MGVSLFHSSFLHGALMPDKPQSLISIHDEACLKDAILRELGARLKLRIKKQLNITQGEAAKRAGMTEQALSNYINGTREMGVSELCRLARALGTSSDWLLGLSEAPPEFEPILVRLLELEGMQAATAQTIAATAREAVAIQRALTDEGDPLLKARMAAQAAWQSRRAPKPS
jgi:transcriptional regulator with XRE-family HTH domain